MENQIKNFVRHPDTRSKTQVKNRISDKEIVRLNQQRFIITRRLSVVLGLVNNYCHQHGHANVQFNQPGRRQRRIVSVPIRAATVRVAAARARRALSENAAVFCYCHRGFYGQMIKCDSLFCRIVWFHTDCVGLADAIPQENDQWFCPDCAAQ